MINFKFKIIGRELDKPSSIYVSVRFGRNDKLMYSTPLKVEPKWWNHELGRVKNSKLYSKGVALNNALQAIDGAMSDFLSVSAVNGKPINKVTIRKALDEHFGKSRKSVGADFHAFFEDFIELCKSRVNSQRGGQTITHLTMQKYAKTYEYIKDYERQEGIYLDFDDINQDFIDRFVAYLQGLNLATNTIGRKITNIKVVMKRAFEQDLTTNTKYQFIKTQNENSDNVALTEDELDQLAELDLSKNPRLERTRDLFLVGCWTGLRFSDVSRLRQEHIGDDDIIKITQLKTNDDVFIPLHPVVKEILEKYDYNLPTISNQKFNEYIKEVCKMAKLDKPFVKSITRGGKKETTVYEKWQVVSSHTARRSFATNLYLAGFPSISIMAITGHKSESSFLKYIKVSKAEHAKKLMEYWNKNKTK